MKPSPISDQQTREALGIIGQIVKESCPAGVEREDAKQHLLLIVLENAKKFDATKATWSTFVGTIAKRRIIDLTRSTTRRKDFLDRYTEATGERVAEIDSDAWGIIERHTKHLSTQQAKVFRHRFGLGVPILSLHATAEKLRVCVQRVQQLERTAKLKMIGLLIKMGHKSSLASKQLLASRKNQNNFANTSGE